MRMRSDLEEAERSKSLCLFDCAARSLVLLSAKIVAVSRVIPASRRDYDCQHVLIENCFHHDAD